MTVQQIDRDRLREGIAKAEEDGCGVYSDPRDLTALLAALDQAEARIHAVREVLDRAEQRHDNAVLFNGANFPAICSAPDIRQALDGDT